MGLLTMLRGHFSGALIHQLERLFDHGTVIGLTEGELLERFVTGRDETAFEALVARHGPMVLGVCRQLLRDPNDVDDAFQATFLVLVRKAGTLRRCDLLGNWLYGVAYRVATRSRLLAARRMARAAYGHEMADAVDGGGGRRQRFNRDAWADWDPEPRPWLHEEVRRLPEKYRIPVLLCYFEGLTHDQAADRLGWPLGTVKGRLARARDLLRKRLTRRGVTLSAAALASHLAVPHARAAVPASLEYATLQAAQAVACHTTTSLAVASAVSLPVAALAKGALQAMIWTQVKAVAITLLVAGVVTTGAVIGATQFSGKGGNAGQANTSQTAPADQIGLGLLSTDSEEVSPDGSSPQPEPQDSGKSTRHRGAGANEDQAEEAATEEAAKSISTPVLQSMRRAADLFVSLLRDRDGASVNVERLKNWSDLTLRADLTLASSHEDRVALYEAHRERMKKLRDITQRLPQADKGQTAEEALAQKFLQEAEQWLDDEKKAQTGMMGMMGAMMQPNQPTGQMMTRMMGGMGSEMTAGKGSQMMGGMGGQMMGGQMMGGMGGQMMGGKGGQMMGGSAMGGRMRRSQPMMGGMMGMMGGARKKTRRNKAEIDRQETEEAAHAAGQHSKVTDRDEMKAEPAKTKKPTNPPPQSQAPSGGGMQPGAVGMMGGMGLGGGMAGVWGIGGQGDVGSLGGPGVDFQNRLEIAQLAAALTAADPNPRNQEILKRLEEPTAMSFASETPLRDVLKYIKTKLDDPNAPIPIYVDPNGLAEVGRSLNSTVMMDLEGVPLKTTLRLMLKQLGLAYCIRDGVLIISSVQGIRAELAEAARELLGAGNEQIDMRLMNMNMMGIGGGMGSGMR
jgi:RNA polymerase sigma factor (sigma-70 family)